MTVVLHAGEIGRFDLVSTILDTDDFLIFRTGELLRIDAPTLADYVAFKNNTFTNPPITADYNIQLTDDIVYVDATTAAVTVTLPLITETRHAPYRIKKLDSSSNLVIIDGNGSTIDGQATLSIGIQFDSVDVHNRSVEWSTL